MGIAVLVLRAWPTLELSDAVRRGSVVSKGVRKHV